MMGISGVELLVIGVLALLVIGPKDLPKALRSFGRAVGQVQRMAWEFQRQVHEMGREMEGAAQDRSRTKPRSPAAPSVPVQPSAAPSPDPEGT